MATGPIETHLHRSFNWENGAPGARMGPRGRSASCGNGLSAQCVRLRSEINLGENAAQHLFCLGGGVNYTVRNIITMIMAKPIRSVGKNTVPSITALVMVAETGSTVPMRLARTEPMSLTPCI